MRIGGSLFLIAVGAILNWAVSTHVNGVNLHTVGWILIIVGAVGLLFTLIWMSTRRRTDVVHRGPAGTTGTTYMTPSDPIDAPY
jgi:NADH:ubiquinone oxidoreductase subunit 6 (subunit J)